MFLTPGVISMQDHYHVIRNVHFLSTNHFSMKPTQVYDTQRKVAFRRSLQQCFPLFHMLMTSSEYFM
jgi:hypothetical protein